MSASVTVGNALNQSAPEAAQPSELGRSLPSWAISLAGHLLVLGCLWPLQIATSLIHDAVVSGDVEEDETVNPLQQQDLLRFDTVAAAEIGNGGDSSGPGDRVAPLGPAIQTPRAPVLNVQGTVAALGTKQIAIKRPMLDVGAATPDRELSDLLETTGSVEHVGGVRGAIDRLTIEIEASLRQENTLVVWLFDATPSMESRRAAIAERFDNIYKQLGLLGVGGNGALKTAVATFGKTIHFITHKPIDDVSAIQKAIHGITDEEGDDQDAVENVFGATLSVADRYRSFRTGKERRRVMIVVVTDERGTDCLRVEEAIGKLRKLGMRVYCVGDDAVFGRDKHIFPHTFSNGRHGLAFTNRGPETVRLESLQLPFWGHGGHLQEITSSFGPYALSRLCSETGGLYFISDELHGPKFDTAILRNYLPDYRPIREYEAEIVRNAAKSALTHAAVEVNVEKVPGPQLQFRADNDNTFRQQITQAQKPIAELEYRLNEMHALLEAGEKDRALLDTPRWRASYDLAMGRVLAMLARADGYNMMLAEMKTVPRPFRTPGDNTWRIVPSSEETAPARAQKLAKRAREYLKGVVEEHRGTQWALLAREELRTPMGWEWQELQVNYPPPAPPRPPGNPVQLEEERRERENMRRQQEEDNTPRKL